MDGPYRAPAASSPSLALSLDHGDRRQGSPLLQTFVLLVPMAALLLWLWDEAVESALLILVGVGVAALVRGLVRAMLALASHRPRVTVSGQGIAIDAGPIDRWCFAWGEIAACWPAPDELKRRLRAGEPVDFALRLRDEPPRRLATRLGAGAVRFEPFVIADGD